jgi:hypothetical protein
MAVRALPNRPGLGGLVHGGESVTEHGGGLGHAPAGRLAQETRALVVVHDPGIACDVHACQVESGVRIAGLCGRRKEHLGLEGIRLNSAARAVHEAQGALGSRVSGPCRLPVSPRGSPLTSLDELGGGIDH